MEHCHPAKSPGYWHELAEEDQDGISKHLPSRHRWHTSHWIGIPQESPLPVHLLSVDAHGVILPDGIGDIGVPKRAGRPAGGLAFPGFEAEYHIRWQKHMPQEDNAPEEDDGQDK